MSALIISLLIYSKNLKVADCEEKGHVATVSNWWVDGGFYVVTCAPPASTTVVHLPEHFPPATNPPRN